MSTDRIFASPYARKLAREKNIDINNVIGSGPNNRVLAADVLEGKLKATISATLDLADWVKAFKLIEERTVVGKAVLVP